VSRRPAPPPGYRLDDDEDDRLPPPPPGYQLNRPQAAPQGDAGPWYEPVPNPPRLPAPTGGITGAHDGDTLTMSTGPSVRLYGIDAPELKQQGWDRQGQAVPIGQMSRDDLTRRYQLAQGIIGKPIGSSYGRAVAPVTIDGNDLGQSLARDGSALAAPTYLKADPQRRFQYMQAERLARQNGLGIHDTMFQPPAEFRHSPQAAPDRETVAQFWDTPTPLGGMRPDAEQHYLAMINDHSVDPAKIVAFAHDNGFNVDPANIAKVREQSSKSGLAVTIGYKDAPKPLTDLGDGAPGAAARGLGSGVLAGGLDELGAFVDAAGLTPGRENLWNSDRRPADIWKNNEDQNAAILGYDDLAHPYAQLGGELAGGLIVPFGAKAKTVPELFRVGAAYGGAQGFLGTDGDLGERAIGGAEGTLLGGALGAGTGKAIEAGLRVAPRLADRFGLKLPRRAPATPGGDSGAIPAVPDIVAAQNAPRTRDIINIDDVPAPPPGYTIDAPNVTPTSTAYPGPSTGGRARDWIDIGEVPAPPSGYTLDQPRSAGNLAMADEPLPSVSQAMPRRPDYLDMGGVRPTRLDDPLTAEQMRRVANDVQPGDVVPIPSNQVGSVEEAAAIDKGRFGPARAPNERGELTPRTFRAFGTGAPVSHRGPLDMVGWLRLNGGLRDQAGELRHMGLDNRGRSMDFAGQETRFGPLVNNVDGLNLDDAAHAAWEAGYFPDHTDRPSINEFLDALRSTHEGRARNFLPEDYPEIDRFHGAQSERYALQEQRFTTGQPIYADKSVPATEPPPIPPPEAYEEWPSGGPDFAGNIRLEKLESPQDISRALDFTSKRVGFDAATRGRVAHAETERLAADLGMTPETLLSRRKGQAFNAEEALAARQILAKSGNELVNAAKRIQGLDSPGDELLAEFRQKWVRHTAIQEQVSGMTAEAGRALQQFRQAADSRAVRGDVLSAMVRSGGGKENLQDAANLLLDAVEQGPGKFNVEVERLRKPQFRDKATELYINSLLTNPATHVVNMVSNTLTSLAQIPEHAVASAIGKARQIIPGANVDRVIASEVGQRAFGLLQGAKEGARLFWQALKSGESSDFVSKVEGQEMKSISGIKGEIVRIPTRLLTAEDELFKGIARRMELNGLAVRQTHIEGLKGEAAKARIAELSEVPTDAMLHASMDYARYLTFQQKLGPAMSKLSGMTQDFRPLKLFLPFIRTPTNLLKFSLERSPAAPLLKEWRTDFQAGGAKRDLAIAKAMIGTGMGMAIYEAAENGLITGSPPTDQARARLYYADGRQPYSIRLGDQWYSYKRLDPFSTTLGIAADMALLPEGMSDRQREDMGTILVASILGNLASKTWLSGLSGLIGAMTEPDRKADELLQRVAGGVAVPAGVAQLARVTDPVARETNSVGEAIQARIPGLSDKLQPRIDVWGRPIASEGGVGPDIVSPIYKSTAHDDPVNRELSRLGYSPGKPRPEISGQKLTPGQYTRYQVEAGQRAHAGLQALVTSPQWRTLDDEAQQAAAEKVVKTARAEAKAVLFPGTSLRKAPRRGSPPPPPPGYTIEGEAGGRNVYGDLLRVIPGIVPQNLTSGYRTPAYQADMRRRGYHPADNSGHLDGSSFDIVPPRGRSIRWLQDRVKAYDPTARLLPEGDHLHATFPGYYGAPALGGARAAKLRNPNAGMPPPPRGYKLNR
jgi:endonuclease YncB( thermonuclease family)